jgi:branched-subunit amino acid aminotransferase/4-amino-4-deoxychorismate lyase
VVAGGILRTPSPASGCLPGITRALILDELAPALGLRANEEELPVTTAFREAHEVFLSNSIGGIVPVAEVEPTAWRRTVHGDVTASLQKAYGDLLARECGTE